MNKLFDNKKLGKRGNLASLIPAVVVLLVVGIVLATAVLVNSNYFNTISGSSVQDTIAKNAILNSSSAFQTISQFMPLLGIIVVASIIFVVLFNAFGGRLGGGAR